jgi:hypothetical protein
MSPLSVNDPRAVYDLLKRFAEEILEAGSTSDEVFGRYIGEVMGLEPSTGWLEWPGGVPLPPQVSDRDAFPDEDL